MSLANPTGVYLDANAIIQFVEGGVASFAILIESAAEKLIYLYTSELTIAEVLVGPLKHDQHELIAIYEDWLASDDVMTVVPISRSVIRRSAEIRATLGNKGPDAIHVATAISSACTIFISSDKRIRLPAGIVRVDVGDIESLDFC